MITCLAYYVIIFSIFSIFFIVKNNITFNNRNMILDAIFAYRTDCIIQRVNAVVDYKDMEDYNKTLFRFYDFGYKHILPEDKFKIIEPYLK